jgi:hypothetical protein
MTDRNSTYMTYDEYEQFIHRAHSSYMKTKYHNDTGKNHVSDIAINSAEFFEIAYHVLTELSGVLHKNDAERYLKIQQNVERVLRAEDELVKLTKTSKKKKKKLW